MEIRNFMECKILKIENNLKSWRFTMKYFSTDFLLNSFDSRSFSMLFRTILNLSSLPEYQGETEKYYYAFRISLSQLFLGDLKGLFDRQIPNLPALVCYLFHIFGYKNSTDVGTFSFFKNYKNNEKRYLQEIWQKLETDLWPTIHFFKSILKLEFNSSASYIIGVVKSHGLEKKGLVPRLNWRNLKCMAILETRLKFISKLELSIPPTSDRTMEQK